MPKNLNYPLASFQKAYELAEAVDALGGSCSIENCAQKMQRKISGGFMVIISSAQKFTLVNSEKGIITISEEYKLIKHSYTNTERIGLLQKAFLSPQVFSILYEKFKGKELPITMLDKILIREFGIEENTAGRVAGYFTDGLKTYNLLNSANVIQTVDEPNVPDSTSTKNEIKETHLVSKVEQQPIEKELINSTDTSFTNEKSEGYILQLSGPGINTKINIKDEEDLQILEAILRKIRKVLI